VEVFRLRLQFEEVDDVDETNFKIREMLAEQSSRRQGFQGRDIARTGHHYVGFAPLVVAGPIPDADALGAVFDGFTHVQVLKVRLFIRDAPMGMDSATISWPGSRE